MVSRVPKTLVIAEKPSVGRDLAGALDGPFQRRKLEDIKPKRGKKKAEGPTNEEVVEAAKSTTKSRSTREEAVFLESDEYVITWAVGHLVQLAEPEDADRLAERGILYAPDYVVNAGGMIHLASLELLGEDVAARDERLRGIGDTLAEVFALAERRGISTAAAADAIVEERLAAGRT